MGLKNTLRNYQLNKLIKNLRQSSTYNGFDSIETIGICFERSNNNQVIFNYKSKMEGLGKKVVLLEYLPFTKKELEKKSTNTEGLWFCKSDLKYSGLPSNTSIESFLSESYDVLLDLNSKEHHPNEFISLKAKASLKAGSSERADLPFDLMLRISEKDNFDGLFKELDYYLNFINQKKK